MICKNCNAEIAEGARFCPKCGVRIEQEWTEEKQDVQNTEEDYAVNHKVSPEMTEVRPPDSVDVAEEKTPEPAFSYESVQEPEISEEENPDTEPPETGSPDTEPPEAGSPDTEPPEAGSPEAGSPDTETKEVETPDTGIPDEDTLIADFADELNIPATDDRFRQEEIAEVVQDSVLTQDVAQTEESTKTPDEERAAYYQGTKDTQSNTQETSRNVTFKDRKRTGKGSAAIVFSVFAAAFLVVLLVDRIAGSNYDLLAAYYLILLGGIMLMVLNAAISNAFTRFLRGLMLAVIFEATILANMGIINNILDGTQSFRSISSVISIIWLFALLIWLIVASVKSMFMRDSEGITFFEAFLAIIVTISAVISVASILEYYRSIMRYSAVSVYGVFLELSIYIFFLFFILANLFLSWRDIKN